jgi:hypothetical protein
MIQDLDVNRDDFAGRERLSNAVRVIWTERSRQLFVKLAVRHLQLPVCADRQAWHQLGIQLGAMRKT